MNTNLSTPQDPQEDDSATRAKIAKIERAKYGLPEDATEEQVMAAIRASIDRNVRVRYGLPEDATNEQVMAAVRASLAKETQQLLDPMNSKI